MNLENSRQYAILQTLLASFLWATSFVVVKVGLAHLDPIWFVEGRLAMSAVLLLAVQPKPHGLRRHMTDKWLWLLGFLNGVGFLLQFLGMQKTSASVAAFLINFSMIFTAIFSWAWLKERFGPVKAVGVVMALLGGLLLSGGLNELRVSGTLIGSMLVVLSGLLWAGYTVISKFVLTRPGIDETTVTAIVLFMAALWILPFAGFWGEWRALGAPAVMVLAYTALFCTVLPFILWLRGLRYISATTSSTILLSEPIFAAVFGFVFLQERLTPGEGLGAVIILTAIGMISFSGMTASAQRPK